MQKMIDPGKGFERLVVDFCKKNWSPETVHENRSFGGRELDVYIETDSEHVFIECTIERTKKKAENDIRKIRDLRRVIVGDAPTKSVRGFFITPQDPSPDVHKVAEDNGSWIEACSLPAFINKYNCSSSYLIERSKRPFGSVRNPADDSTSLDRNLYVSVQFNVVDTSQSITIDRIVDDIMQQNRLRYVLTGDFGVGKSMTFRELFYRLAEKYNNGESYRFPLYINLNDTSLDEHDDAVDLIERHAKWVGLRDKRDQLVHAWTSDGCIVLLDGFDELIRAGFTRLTTSSKDIRFASSHIIRAIISSSPKSTPILVSGRESYFATFSEMRESLGAANFSHVSLHDLKESEVIALYRKIIPKDKNPIVLDWMPQRPLLLSYIYFELRDRLKELGELLTPPSPGDGWNSLLNKLSSRETNVAKGAEPVQIRRLVERVALYARTNIAAEARATSLHIAQAFRDVFNMEPDLSVQQVLMRLPGLTAGHTNEDRSFIDRAIYEAAQAGSLVDAIEFLATRNKEFLKSDHCRKTIQLLKETRTAISTLTAEVVIAMLRERNALALLGIALLEVSSEFELRNGNLAADLLVCAMQEPSIALQHGLRSIAIRSALIPNLEVCKDSIQKVRLSFEDCVIETLELSVEPEELHSVAFVNCRFGTVDCQKSIVDELQTIGVTKIENTINVIDATNADILAMNIPDQFKITKIVLRKLFKQAGAGRKKAAFFRGIGDLDTELVDKCLSSLLSHKLVYVVGSPRSDSSVWHPNRAHANRANFLIDTLSLPDDVLLDWS
jgi:hypothetical protein